MTSNAFLHEKKALAFSIRAGVAFLIVCAHSALAAETVAVPNSISTPTQRSFEEKSDAQPGVRAQAVSDHRAPGLEGLRRAGVGTGFFIASDKVLTNFHVVKDCTAWTVGNNREGAEVTAMLLAGDAEVDLAVLSANETGTIAARFVNPDEIRPGARFAIVGYPEHGLPVLEAEMNQISAVHQDLLGYRRLYSFFGAVRHGNSGSPVLDDSGTVVGVVTAKIDTVAVYKKTGAIIDDIGYAIANTSVFDFLHRNNIAFQIAAPAETLPAARILTTAHDFVRQVGCWR